MEIKRATAPDGITYRIFEEVSSVKLYVVEKMKAYDDGAIWFPDCLPWRKTPVYKSLEEAEVRFNELITGEVTL